MYAAFPAVDLWMDKLRRSRSGALKALTIFTVIWLSTLLLSGAVDARGAFTSPEQKRFWKKFIEANPIVQLPPFLLGMLSMRLYRSLSSKRHYLCGRGYLLYLPAAAAAVFALAHAKAFPYW